ncbi:hypothetical protein ES708_10638 [subsurface metagenome]|jgi:hypothetical protein
MKHLGWKIVFGLSWIPGVLLYGNFINCLISMGESGTEGLAGGIGFFILLIPTILYLGLQVALGYLAFRR